MVDQEQVTGDLSDTSYSSPASPEEVRELYTQQL